MTGAVFWSAWLSAAWWCLGPILGATVMCALARLTGGAWGDAILPAARALARRLPRVLLLFLPLVPGLKSLYPFASGGDGWLHGIDRPAFLSAWFSPWFFIGRAFVYALAAWVMARPSRLAHGGQGRAAITLILYLLLGSLAAVDAIGGLMPTWHSSVFALTVLAGQLVAGMAACTCLACMAGTLPLHEQKGPPGAFKWENFPFPELGRDLGNLLLMALMLWAYLAFMQLLIIWAENLPKEITWYLPRLRGPWRWGGLALAVLYFALPLVCLLFRSIKERPRRLVLVAGAVWALQLLDTAWQVLPSVVPLSATAPFLTLVLAAAMGFAVFVGLPKELRHAAN